MSKDAGARESALRSELAAIEQAKKMDADAKKKTDRLNAFKERPACSVLGRAYLSYDGRQRLDIASVSVSGNCGQHYPLEAGVCSQVKTYFHNCISDQMRRRFKADLDALADKLVAELLDSPKFVVELMGLGNLASLQKLFHAEDITAVETELRNARHRRLDQFDRKDLERVLESGLSHGGGILREYLDSTGDDD